MVGEINFFNSMSHLEPHCPRCEATLKYGENTRYDDDLRCHFCISCGEKLK
ncbi:MAG: hypothetical protein V1735_06445 [Nanoarchaeota archaeon]